MLTINVTTLLLTIVLTGSFVTNISLDIDHKNLKINILVEIDFKWTFVITISTYQQDTLKIMNKMEKRPNLKKIM